MDTDKFADKLSDLLPDRPMTPGLNNPDSNALAKAEAERIKQKKSARELARIKAKEKRAFDYDAKKREKYEALAKELGVDSIPLQQTESQARKIAKQQRNIEAIEAIEAQEVNPLDPKELAAKGTSLTPQAISSLQALQGTTRPEVVKLLTSLNINLNLQLTKNDTANLVACLLTCNETQLKALLSNKKVPMAIKIVIKRLLDDAKCGAIDTVYKLWDRIFGKNAMSLNLPDTTQIQTGILPNQPISREAYILIRDTLI